MLTTCTDCKAVLELPGRLLWGGWCCPDCNERRVLTEERHAAELRQAVQEILDTSGREE